MANGTHAFRFRGFTKDNDGDWHNKVLNFGYVGGQPSFIEEYDDNVLTQNRTSSDYNQAQVLDQFIEIGRSLNTGGINANYTIDHFQIYDRFQTVEEINWNYNNGNGIDHVFNETGLDVFYGFNEYDDSWVIDRMENYDADITFFNNDTMCVNGKVMFDYYTTGNVYSKNFVSGLNTTGISLFYYNSDVPSTNSSLKIQFSEDNSTWYNTEGVLNGFDVLSNGTDTLNLRGLNFKSNLFYFCNYSNIDAFYTGKLYSVVVTYEESMTDLTLMYMVFFLVFGMLLTSLLGLIKPVICFATIGITLMVVIPIISTLDNFLISFSVGSLFFQVCFLMLGYVKNR
jgi:hypothetical protein